MPKQGAEDQILSALEERAGDHDVDIVCVEVVGATKNPCVRVRIDHADETAETISLDEVTEQTEWISEVIDEVDPFSGSFTLEVSSPGLDRPLRRAHDFERFAGSDVTLTTTAMEGRRKFSGTLLGIDSDVVSLDCDGEKVQINLSDIKKCNVKPDFAAAAKGKK